MNFIESSSQIIRPNLTTVLSTVSPESLHIVQWQTYNVHCHHVKIQRRAVIIEQFIVHSKLRIVNPVFSTIEILIYSSNHGFIPFWFDYYYHRTSDKMIMWTLSQPTGQGDNKLARTIKTGRVRVQCIATFCSSLLTPYQVTPAP